MIKICMDDINPLSIIIPVYNTEEYLIDCLDSVKSTLSDIEIICINNKTTDNSLIY